MTIAVDFDGVIHAYSEGWKDGSIYDDEIPGAISGIMLLMIHHAVFIHTSRKPTQVVKWMHERSDIECTTLIHPLPWKRKFWNTKGLLLVTNKKLPATSYIDDRAYQFEGWYKTIDDFIHLDMKSDG